MFTTLQKIESKSKRLAWLDDWLDSYAAAISASDAAAWMPFDWSLLRPYYSDLFLEKLSEARKRARASPDAQRRAQESFYGPLMLQLLLQSTLFDLKATRRTRDADALETLNWVHELFYDATLADHYNSRSVVRHSPAQVAEIMESTEWSEGSEDSGRNVGRLVNSCAELGWALYSDYYYSAWCHVYGPYALTRNRCLLIRFFPNFDAGAVWPSLEGFVPRSVEIRTVYEAAGIELDLWSHLKLKTKTPLVKAMREYAVRADGKTLGDAEIKSLHEKLGEAAARHYAFFKTLDFEEQKKKLVWLEAFALSRLFEAVGMEWRPDARVLERIAGKPLLDEEAFYADFDKAKAKRAESWKRFLDVRNDFFPKGFHSSEVT